MATCPCELAGPCMDECTCFNPLRSGGCSMCATFGSKEQRRRRAFHLLNTHFMFHIDYKQTAFRLRDKVNFGAKKVP